MNKKRISIFLSLFATAVIISVIADCEQNDLTYIKWGDWKVEVNRYGNLKRVFLERGEANIDALEKFNKLSGVKPNIWKVALVIPMDMSAEWKDAEGNVFTTRDTFTQEEVQFIKKEFEYYERLVNVCSGGNLLLDTREIILTEPVKIKHDSDFFFPEPLKEELLKLPDWKPEETDSVVCIFPPGEMPLDALGRSWGDLHGENMAGNANIGFIRQRIKEKTSLAITMQHEWLHQAECVMFNHLGYTGVPTLHEAGQNGYTADDNDYRQWLAWNTDLMYRFYRPKMWQVADMNSRFRVKPHPKFDGGFINEWLLLGAFPNIEGKGLDTPYIIDEGQAKPNEGEKGAGGARWNYASKEDGMFDLTSQLQPNTNVVAYAFSYIYSPKKQEAILWLGSDDRVKVFLNGLEIHKVPFGRGLRPDEDKINVILQKGWNRLMLKLDQGSGGWGFCARFSDLNLEQIPDLKFSARRPQRGITNKADIIEPKWDGKLFSWDEVSDDVFAKTPELTLKMLQKITGNPNLTIKSQPPLLLIHPGVQSQELSRLIYENDPKDTELNNQLNASEEAIAVLRFRAQKANAAFPDGLCDLIFVRADIVEPFMDLFSSKSAVPLRNSLAGFYSINGQTSYVFLSYLGKNLPTREIDLAGVCDSGLRLTSYFDDENVSAGERLNLITVIENESNSPVSDCSIRISLQTGNVFKGHIINYPTGTLMPYEKRRFTTVFGGREPIKSGEGYALIEANGVIAGRRVSLKKPAMSNISEPLELSLAVQGAGIIKRGSKRKIIVTLNNYQKQVIDGQLHINVAGDGKINPLSLPVKLLPLQKNYIAEFVAEFGETAGACEITASFNRKAEGLPAFTVKKIDLHGDSLFTHTFENGLEGWCQQAGAFSIEQVSNDKAIEGKSAIVKDGGGCRYGSVLIFGPGKNKTWDKSYSSDEYPLIEFDIATESTANSGIIVTANGKQYVLLLTGKFVERWGDRKEIGKIEIVPDGKPAHVVFNLDEALDNAVGTGAHNIEQIWFGDTRSHWSNQWIGNDENYYVFDNFKVKK